MLHIPDIPCATDRCNDYSVKEVRYSFALSEPAGETRVTPEYDEYTVRLLPSRKPDFANSFTTGPVPIGYSFDGMDLDVHSENCSARNVDVEIWSSKDDGTPWATQWRLTKDAGMNSRYSAPSGARLEPSTTYWVVPPRNSIWALITRILCPRVSGGEQIRWQDRGFLR